jgi:hypothetical protein
MIRNKRISSPYAPGAKRLVMMSQACTVAAKSESGQRAFPVVAIDCTLHRRTIDKFLRPCVET